MSGMFSAFVGRLGSDPEKKTIGKEEVLVLNVAVKDYPEEVTWVKVITRQLGIEDLICKGTSVFVVGKQVVSRRAEDKGGGYWGPEVRAWDVQIIAGFKESNKHGAEAGAKGNATQASTRRAKAADADIPF